MEQRYPPVDLSRVKTYPLATRQSKVSSADFAQVWTKGSNFNEFFARLPNILAGGQLKALVAAMVAAFQAGQTIILAMGAHVIKVGLNPVVIDLMERGVISAIALNGAGIIHDLEVALAGQTSEDVAAAIDDGSFGMAQETCALLALAARQAGQENAGLGRSVGRLILEKNLPFAGQSILAAGCRLGLPVTVHVAIGTDIIHMHPQFDAAATGAASHRDFRTLAAVVATLEGGVYLNVGSAVILPEVFLKALTLVRNLGHRVDRFTTANLDFIQHYRPLTNVVHRPTAKGGLGLTLTGHHEIMLPIIAAAIIEQIG